MTRAERRHRREKVIAKRKFIATKIWRDFKEFPHEGSAFYKRVAGWYQPVDFGRYAKFNLNCGCKGCHSEKYFKEKRKRRRALESAINENIKSFE